MEPTNLIGGPRSAQCSCSRQLDINLARFGLYKLLVHFVMSNGA